VKTKEVCMNGMQFCVHLAYY